MFTVAAHLLAPESRGVQENATCCCFVVDLDPARWDLSISSTDEDGHLILRVMELHKYTGTFYVAQLKGYH